MSELGDILRARIPERTYIPETIAVPATRPAATVNFWQTRQAVGNSADLQRILALPVQATPPDNLVGILTERYMRKGGTMTLKPIQALALWQAEQAQGLIAPIGVGFGKTIVSLLAANALGVQVAVLMVPPTLKSKLYELEYPHLVKHWKLPQLAGSSDISPDATCILHVVAYSELSTVKGQSRLEELNPQAIILDEAHSVARKSAARTKRFLRYFKAHPDTRLVALSGSLLSRSIKDIQHLAKRALGTQAPIPLDWNVLDEWASALDPSDNPTPAGAMAALCGTAGWETLTQEALRAGFRRRFVQSPGVVATAESELSCSLVLQKQEIKTPPEVLTCLEQMRSAWVTPGGEEITDAMTLSRYGRQLSSGLYYRWVWPNAEPLPVRKEWLEARRDWHREVRHYLTHRATKGMDSPLLLAQAAATGRWMSEHWSRWSERKDTCEPQTEAVWVSEFLAQDAAEWGRKHVGIIWYTHAALGAKIAEIGGFPLYASGNAASSGLIKEDGSRTCVVSENAHREGKNLQMFVRQLVTTPSSSGKRWEQKLGRTHRQGQLADEVTCALYLHTPEMRDALSKARDEARFVEQTTGAAQKLLYCDYQFNPNESLHT